MAKTPRTRAEEARDEFPALLAAAEGGRSTIITRHGRPVAAIVPIEEFAGIPRQRSISALKGSGRGLWGRDSTRALRDLREEWSR